MNRGDSGHVTMVCKSHRNHNINKVKELFPVPEDGITGNNNLKLKKGLCRLNIRKSFIAAKADGQGHSLPRELREA